MSSRRLAVVFAVALVEENFVRDDAAGCARLPRSAPKSRRLRDFSSLLVSVERRRGGDIACSPPPPDVAVEVVVNADAVRAVRGEDGDVVSLL